MFDKTTTPSSYLFLHIPIGNCMCHRSFINETILVTFYATHYYMLRHVWGLQSRMVAIINVTGYSHRSTTYTLRQCNTHAFILATWCGNDQELNKNKTIYLRHSYHTNMNKYNLMCSLSYGQWRASLVFSLICAWINGWVNNREAGDLRRHHPHNGFRHFLDSMHPDPNRSRFWIPSYISLLFIIMCFLHHQGKVNEWWCLTIEKKCGEMLKNACLHLIYSTARRISWDFVKTRVERYMFGMYQSHSVQWRHMNAIASQTWTGARELTTLATLLQAPEFEKLFNVFDSGMSYAKVLWFQIPWSTFSQDIWNSPSGKKST